MSDNVKEPCSLCGRVDRPLIDQALRAGVSLRKLAREFICERLELREHRRCLGLPDSGEDAAEEATKNSGTVARARVSTEGSEDGLLAVAKNATSRAERLSVCADILASGAHISRPLVKRLAGLWNVDHKTAQSYFSTAAAMISLDRGTLAVQRESSVAATVGLRQKAIKAGDLKAALSAQVHADRITGVFVQTPQFVAILGNPLVTQFIDVVSGVLQAHPEAKHAVEEALQRWQESIMMPSVTPALTQPNNEQETDA